MVKEVLEHISGESVDVELIKLCCSSGKGASLLRSKRHLKTLLLCAYKPLLKVVQKQYGDGRVCKRRVHRFRYAAIAKDEGFHANIGGWKLAELAEGAADSKNLRYGCSNACDLAEISAKNTAIAVY